MNAKFIVRLLTSDNDLLAWAEVVAEARPQGRPRSAQFVALAPTLFVIEQGGVAARISVHWADLDLVRQNDLPERVPVQPGQMLRFDWIEPVWMVKGSEVDIPLPPVTVRKPVAVSVPVGSLGAESYG